MTLDKPELPLSEEESALLALAGWHHVGGGIYNPSTDLPYADGVHRLYFRHDDGRKVAWTRAEARDEIARIRALWVQIPALLRLARCVAEERDAAQAMDKAITDSKYLGAQARYRRAVLATAAALEAIQ